MSKFVFSLENALKYRQSIEEQEIERLTRAMQKVQAEEGASMKLNLEKQNHLKTYDSEKINLTTMRQQEAYLTLLDLRIKSQLKKLEQAIFNFKNQRALVIKASTNKKILETLKEKYLEEHQLLLAKTEQKFLDDIAISAYCYKTIY